MQPYLLHDGLHPFLGLALHLSITTGCHEVAVRDLAELGEVGTEYRGLHSDTQSACSSTLYDSPTKLPNLQI